MNCVKCKRPIPNSAEKCPYCGKKTVEGWKKEGERTFIKPFKDLAKTIKKR